jgi:hypothetical protein
MRRSVLKRGVHARPRTRPARAFPALLALTLAISACADEPTTPQARGGEEDGGTGTPPRTLGLVEITISGLGSGHVTSSALSAPTAAELDRLRALRDAGGAAGPGSLAPQAFSLPRNIFGPGRDGTIQLELASTGSFTEGARGAGGYRYLWATYRVRNAQTDGATYNTSRQNLTFYAVDTDSTIGQTAISQLKRFDGSPADDAIASAFVPTGAVSQGAPGTVVSRFPDVLQVLTETEAASLLTLANTAGLAVTDVFPWGFVVRNPNTPTSRTLPASPGASRFDGLVTFAFKVPLQASPADDPFTVSLRFMAVDDDQVKITQAPEEQTPAGRAAFAARAAALGASVFTLLPPSGDAVLRGSASARVRCDVRVAGAAGAGATTAFPPADTSPWPVPSPFRTGPFFLPRDGRLGVASCSSIASANATSFAVHGFQSGRATGTYSGVGGTFVRAPVAPGGAFLPGEEVEVTLSTALGRSKPLVARYRVAATGGSGAFSPVATYDRVWSPVFVALGDMNADGRPDILAVNWDSATISHFRNTGGGSFEFVQKLNTQSGNPSAVAVGDLNADGYSDLVIPAWGSSMVRVYYGSAVWGGPGGFPSSFYVGTNPAGVALGDLDGDGDLDVVTANAGSHNISVLIKTTGVSFATHVTYAVGTKPKSVALGDLDGDGDLDVVTANEDSDDVSVLLNRGDGTFDAPVAYGVGGLPQSIALGDVDGDGDLDIVTANYFSDNVSVLLNRGDGRFEPGATIPVGERPTSVALGDVDGDGDLDIVTANGVSDSISVLLNRGDGSFAGQISYPVGDGPLSVALGDVDGDGDLDVVVALRLESRVVVLRNP